VRAWPFKQKNRVAEQWHGKTRLPFSQQKKPQPKDYGFYHFAYQADHQCEAPRLASD